VNEAPFEAAWSELAYHGGNLSAARRLYPDAPTPWIDLSTGINPHPYPLSPIPIESWTRLPEAGATAALEASAARRYGADPAAIIAAAGTQAIVQMLAKMFASARVAILGFTYGGYEHAWRAAGARIETVDDLPALAEFDVAIVANPNNPDGRLTSRASLVDLHAAMAPRRGTLIVDEAFMDLDRRGQSLAPSLPSERAIVLRSFGKTYGLAGLRLGFALASADLAAPLRASLGAWPVNGPAIEIGRRALADDLWLEETKLRMELDHARLQRLLVDCGFQTIGGAILFHCARHERARDIFVDLLRQGILCRPFAPFPDRLRFGVPGGPEAWRRLELALGRK
jgi:cobalamin biosynthetic protein CobC